MLWCLTMKILYQILAVHFPECSLMSMGGSKLSGEVFLLRLLSFSSQPNFVVDRSFCSWLFGSRMQLKFGCSSSEDHQFVRGIPIYTISQVLDKILSGANGPPLLINGVKRPMPLVRILEVELYPTLLSKARSFGLSDEWVQVFFLFGQYLTFK